MKNNMHTEADRATWLIICVQYASNTTGISVKELARRMNMLGITDWLLSGYRSFHTQGYEYMAEMIADMLNEVRERDSNTVLLSRNG